MGKSDLVRQRKAAMEQLWVVELVEYEVENLHHVCCPHRTATADPSAECGPTNIQLARYTSTPIPCLLDILS